MQSKKAPRSRLKISYLRMIETLFLSFANSSISSEKQFPPKAIPFNPESCPNTGFNVVRRLLLTPRNCY